MSEFDPAELERRILARWDQEGTFKQSLERRAKGPRFSFYDGPPYATGAPHYGHILQSAIKDTVARYWTMRGYRVDRRVGWDCHGLPVENLVERELGVTRKKDIEALELPKENLKGVEAFNVACRRAVLRHVGDFTALLRRFGRWADYEYAYSTMDTTYMESVWWVFKQVWERGYVTQGVRSSPYCPRCETPLSNFETAQGYQEVTEPAVTIKLRLEDEPNTFLLVWTTTPWTLPANAAVAVHPELRYVRVRVGDERWIVARERVADIIREDYVQEDEFLGSALVGKTYAPLYTFVEPDAPAYRVVAASFVGDQDGTGLVHVAPAFGDDDFELAQDERLPLIRTVDSAGRFLPAVKPWAGQFVKEADPRIVADLEEQGVLVRSEMFRHEYPHCWRCKTPLIYFATESWVVRVTAVKEQLLQNTAQISWVPAHLKEGRFGQGLKDAPDWAISRTRFWGTPLPVWRCGACARDAVVGSVAELKEQGGDLSLLRSPYSEIDLHRPYIDRVVLRCAHCGGEARRVPEVLDVWFDAGCMPYAQWHYPFENRELVPKTFPADFIAEALEQTRGWFYTLHVLAGILTERDVGLGTHLPAYRHVIASGVILAEDGKKLSKSLQNYPDPQAVIDQYGADTLRLYLLTSSALGDDYRFSDRMVNDIYRRCTLLLWNVWEYYRTYSGSRQRAAGSGQQAGSEKEGGFLDRWIVARLEQLTAEIQRAMDDYRVDIAARALLPFVDDLSTWYVRRSRGRESALPVLQRVLVTFARAASPFLPFLADHLHRELTGVSSHLDDFPGADGQGVVASDHAVLAQMQAVREVASIGQRLRALAKVKVRQPLRTLVLNGAFPDVVAAGEEGLQLLKDELNVKDIQTVSSQLSGDSFGEGWVWFDVPGGRIGLDIKVTPELKREGLARDLVRLIQELRKKAGCAIDETITLFIATDATDIQAAIHKHRNLLLSGTRSQSLSEARGAVDCEENVELAGSTVWIGLQRGR